MLSRTNTRLQEFLNNDKLFAGRHVIFVGDLFQLRPVSGNWVFMPPSMDYGPIATNIWKENITMYELTEIMRQKDDKEYALILNRLRENKQTQSDIEKIETRIITEKNPEHPNYPLKKPHAYATNVEVNNFNSNVYDRSDSEKIEVNAVDVVVGDLSKSIKNKHMQLFKSSSAYRKRGDTGQLESTLQLAVGLDYDMSTNECNEDGLVNLKHQLEV